MAGLERLPAFIRDDTDDASALELALIENAARQDLTPVEEARTLSALINDLGVTQGVLAERICRSRSDLANTLRLLDLSARRLAVAPPRRPEVAPPRVG
jgi:ParB family chromosome partitioning protein